MEYCPYIQGPQGQRNYYECLKECGSYNRCHGLVKVKIIEVLK